MLKNSINTYIEEILSNSNQEILLYKEEKEFAEKYKLIPNGVTIINKEATTRFLDSYIERVDKESEDLISEESPETFLKQPIHFLKKNKNEFVYMESKWFEMINVDALTIEQDDVFGTINVLIGLKQLKKVGDSLRAFLSNEIKGDETSYQLMFNDKDGLWDLNFACNGLEGFHEDMLFEEVYDFVYRFLFRMVTTVGQEKIQYVEDNGKRPLIN